MLRGIRRNVGVAALGAVAALLLAGITGGCGGSSGGLSPEEILSQSADRTGAVESFHVLVSIENVPAPSSGLSLTFAEGDVDVPDRLRARINGTFQGVPLESELIVVGDSHWLKIPFTGQWQEVDVTATPVGFLDPERGRALGAPRRDRPLRGGLRGGGRRRRLRAGGPHSGRRGPAAPRHGARRGGASGRAVDRQGRLPAAPSPPERAGFARRGRRRRADRGAVRVRRAGGDRGADGVVVGASGAEPGTAVVARGVARRYGARTALEPTDLEVAAGELVVLVGPNGAGKSTLIALLAGALPPSSGTVTSALLPVAIGWAPQRPAQYRRLSARENLGLFARLQRLADPDGEAGAMLAELGLPDDARPSAQLSVGNQQRLNLALAFLGSPRLLLLDEPTASLDPPQARALWERVGRARATGAAAVIATHLPGEAGQADRVLALSEGRVVFAGTPTGYREAAGA